MESKFMVFIKICDAMIECTVKVYAGEGEAAFRKSMVDFFVYSTVYYGNIVIIYSRWLSSGRTR